MMEDFMFFLGEEDGLFLHGDGGRVEWAEDRHLGDEGEEWYTSTPLVNMLWFW